MFCGRIRGARTFEARFAVAATHAQRPAFKRFAIEFDRCRQRVNCTEMDVRESLAKAGGLVSDAAYRHDAFAPNSAEVSVKSFFIHSVVEIAHEQAQPVVELLRPRAAPNRIHPDVMPAKLAAVQFECGWDGCSVFKHDVCVAAAGALSEVFCRVCPFSRQFRACDWKRSKPHGIDGAAWSEVAFDVLQLYGHGDVAYKHSSRVFVGVGDALSWGKTRGNVDAGDTLSIFVHNAVYHAVHGNVAARRLRSAV